MVMASSYQIVLARRDHLEQLQQVELAAAAVFSEEDVPENIRSTATCLDDFASAQADEMLWTALTSDGIPVGFVIVRRLDGLAFILEIDVHPDHGHRGIGTSLINTVCEWTLSHGIAAIALTTFRHLSWNAPWYERLGFRSLSQDELTPGLEAVLADEVANGLDPLKRVAMLKQM